MSETPEPRIRERFMRLSNDADDIGYGQWKHEDIAWLLDQLSDLRAQHATQQAEWTRLAELFKTGGMTDPAFLVGMVEAEHEQFATQQAELERLRTAFRTTGGGATPADSHQAYSLLAVSPEAADRLPLVDQLIQDIDEIRGAYGYLLMQIALTSDAGLFDIGRKQEERSRETFARLEKLLSRPGRSNHESWALLAAEVRAGAAQSLKDRREDDAARADVKRRYVHASRASLLDVICDLVLVGAARPDATGWQPIAAAAANAAACWVNKNRRELSSFELANLATRIREACAPAREGEPPTPEQP